ncbi:MAG TPA: hypothetical protein VNC59_05040 [Thermoanaerobaculia bacterium]|nr:hypothetical protein [Thermoanaerobaculia bacterium]
MISIRYVALAAVVVFALPASASAQCRQGDLRSSGFHLDVDWGRPTYSGGAPSSGRLFPASSALARRAAMPECVFAAAVDRPRLVLASAAAPVAATASTQSASDLDDGGSSWLRPFTFFVNVGGIYDSNINHDEEPIRTWGTFFGGGVRFETDDFYAQYEIASFSYTYTDSGWSRISHRLETAYEHDLSKKWEAELVGEAALKGSSEDNDLGDEYTLKPRLNYDLSDSQRIRLYGAYRLRSYGDIDPLRDANNYYVGLQFRQRIGTGHFDAEYRWEVNESKGPRNRYNRQTYGLEYTTPFGGGLHQLVLEARYRPVQYWHRRIDNEDDEDLRRDVRWIGTAVAKFSLSRRISIHPTYRYERRTSNDPEEEWDAHLGILSIQYTFGGATSVPVAITAAKETPAEKDMGSDPRRGSDPSPTIEASAAAPDPIEPWVERAESDRRRLERESRAQYSIDLARACEAETLARIWKADVGGALWLLSDPAAGGNCFRVFWGRYSTRETAIRALSSVPPGAGTPGTPPTVIVPLGKLRATR